MARVPLRIRILPANQRRSMMRLIGAIGAAGVVLLNLTSASYDDFLLFLGAYLAMAGAAAFAVGYTMHRVRMIRSNGDIDPFDYTAWLAVVAFVTGMTVTSFMIFKQFVLPPRGFPYDHMLAALDRLLFLGHDPWTLTHKILPGWQAAKLLDIAYSDVWLTLMFCFPVIAICCTKTYEMRLRLVSCWLISWVVIGSIAAWLLGSAGPSYYNALVGPDASFHLLNLHLQSLAQQADAAGYPISTLRYQHIMFSGFGSTELSAFGGISAMPSMHVAMATLFAIGAFHIRRWLGWVMSGFALVIWFGSVHFGWHYATDGVVGAVMMSGLWYMTALLVRSKAGVAPLLPNPQTFP